MKITTITFSPTGGTLKCANILADAIGEVGTHIDLTKKDLETVDLKSDDVVVIGVPSYGGRIPNLAVNRLKLINGCGAKAVILVVYGNRAYEDALIELEDVAMNRGFKVIAGVSAVARHSIVTKIAADRPDAADKKLLHDFGTKIKAKLGADSHNRLAITGNRPYKKAGSAIAPKTNKQCNDCGTCAVLCPSGAINIDNPRIIDTKVCINCMRCVEVCPKDAKYIPKLMLWLVSQVLKKPCSTRKTPELFI